MSDSRKHLSTQIKALDGDLLQAIKNNNSKKASSLLNQKANPNAVHSLGNTALIIATNMGYTEIAKALIAAKAKLDAVNDNGKTALYTAERCKNVTIANLLKTAINKQKNLAFLTGAVQPGKPLHTATQRPLFEPQLLPLLFRYAGTFSRATIKPTEAKPTSASQDEPTKTPRLS